MNDKTGGSEKKSPFLPEHGLSLWIAHNDRYILFDVGQSHLIILNAKKAGIELAQADAIVLSHGHCDHIGALSEVLDIASKASVILHPAAIDNKFSKKPNIVKYCGITNEVRKSLLQHHPFWNREPYQVSPGIFVTGEIPRTNNIEDTGGAFFLDRSCRIPDEIRDDQALFIESKKSRIVVLGCAHAGVVNTLDYIDCLAGFKELDMIIGGMHLLHAGPLRIDKTIDALKRRNVQTVVPLHCTGDVAFNRLNNAFGDQCLEAGAGDTIRVEVEQDEGRFISFLDR